MTFLAPVPEIPAADVDPAIAYYVNTLGFTFGPILFWLNLNSKAEVDELFAEWKAAQAKIVSEAEDKPWKLREFMAADLDGNLIRAFYDFRSDL
jgi:uncharacterized glyoxalase superfamily protein PhnB